MKNILKFMEIVMAAHRAAVEDLLSPIFGRPKPDNRIEEIRKKHMSAFERSGDSKPLSAAIQSQSDFK